MAVNKPIVSNLFIVMLFLGVLGVLGILGNLGELGGLGEDLEVVALVAEPLEGFWESDTELVDGFE